MSYFATGGPGKEHGTNKPPLTRRVQERSKGDTTCPTTSQNPPLWHPSWLNKAYTTRKDSESEWLAKDNRKLIPSPWNPSHVAELFTWVPLPYCSPPGCPFPVKSLALSAHVSPHTIHFRMIDKSPVSGPGRGHPSCNRTGVSYIAGGFLTNWASREALKKYSCFVFSIVSLLSPLLYSSDGRLLSFRSWVCF